MRRVLGVALAALLIPALAGAQSGVKKRRPLPPEFGRVSIGTSYADQKYPDAQFRPLAAPREVHLPALPRRHRFRDEDRRDRIPAPEDNIAGYPAASATTGRRPHGRAASSSRPALLPGHRPVRRRAGAGAVTAPASAREAALRLYNAFTADFPEGALRQRDQLGAGRGDGPHQAARFRRGRLLQAQGDSRPPRTSTSRRRSPG